MICFEAGGGLWASTRWHRRVLQGGSSLTAAPDQLPSPTWELSLPPWSGREGRGAA